MVRLSGGEIERNWGETSLIHPGGPVNSSEKVVNLLRSKAFDIVFNEEFPGFSKLNCGDTSKRVLLHVESKELLHLRTSNK